MILIFDCEASGLDVHSDRVWCVVAKDFETGKVYEFPPDKLGEVEKLFCSAEKIVAHNGIAYDLPILKNNGILPKDFPFGKIVDTLVLSRLYYPDRENGHSVEAWGKKLGYPKVEHEDWSQFTPDMMHRCRTDVEIQTLIYKELLKERGEWDWTLSEKIEHRVQQILFEQETRGWRFHVDRARELVEWLEGEMEKLEQEIVPKLPLYLTNKGEVKKPFKKDGNLTKQAEDWIDERKHASPNCGDFRSWDNDNSTSSSDNCLSKIYPVLKIRGPFTRVEWNTISLSQRGKLAEALIQMGWEPSSYTEKGSPQITPDKNPCPNLEKLGDIGPKLSRYYLCSHRKGQISGWLEHVREDGRLPSVAIGNSTNTHRMSHKIIANVPKASDKVFLGKEMRDLFICEDGYKLVGWDAEGLELRVLAHYMNDPEFTEAIVNGRKEDKTDIHNLMLQASEGIVPDRDTVKNCVYAIVYGAGDYKLGQTAGYSKGASKKGKELRRKWGKRFPKLSQLVESVSKASERGYLIAIDGRKVWMRRDPFGKIMTHKGLNTLIQATGSVIVKMAVCYLRHMVDKSNVMAYNLIIYHDEDESEVIEKDVDRYKELCYKSIQMTEKKLNFKCPLSIEVKEGLTWGDCH